MKLALVFLAAALAYSAGYSPKMMKPLSDAEIDYINSVQTSWKAGRNFDEDKLEYVKKMLGARVDPAHQNISDPRCSSNRVADIPETFDSRKQWPNCETMHDIWDQGECGSCWAFAAAEAMSDRICVATKKNFLISPQDILSCCNICGFGCEGGWPYQAWKWFNTYGVVTGGAYESKEGCLPYTLNPCTHTGTGTLPPCEGVKETPKCQPECVSSYPSTYEEDKHTGKIQCQEKGIDAMKRALYNGGPVSVLFTIYSDFISYKSGIYKHTTGWYLGSHAVKALGWGKENGTEYWILANSWNDEWGEDGFFRMALGECGIEEYVIYGLIE